VALLAMQFVLWTQMSNVPRGMFIGGNELRDMGKLRAEQVGGSVVDPNGSEIGRARIQIQVQGSEKILRDIAADEKGRFRLPSLPQGIYWLGVSSPGFNLHFW
jgi:carboxypeptidase family protein